MKKIKMDPGFAEQKMTYKQLMKYTNNFSEENFLGTFQFGKVYRGKIEYVPFPPEFVMVKVWEISEISHCSLEDIEARVMLEIILLRHERLNSHHGVIELYGYCWDGEHLGAVYNFNPLDTLHNLVPKDSFTWLRRIKFALRFAQLLKFLHTGTPPYMPFLVRNIGAAHIVLDEQYNPKLFDFSMISGGIFPDTTMYEDYYTYGCYGYIDPSIEWSGEWSEKTDVFAFGVLLLNLITKRINTEEDRLSGISPIYEWAWGLYQPYDSDSKSDCEADSSSIEKPVHSLVHQSLALDHDFSVSDGCVITMLAMKCIDKVPDERPTMKQVIRYLLKLQVVKNHAEFLELGSKLQARIDG